MTIRELKAKVDELCEQDPQMALALARRIERKLGLGVPFPLAELHRRMVAEMLEPPSEELIEKTRETLEQAGHSQEEIERFIAEFKKPGLKVGQGFGGLHLEDVLAYLEVLFYQGAGRFVLEIEFENPDDDHLYLTIREIGRARWQEQETG
ncbi:MAG: hypothetical protein ACE5LD_00935 [Candidatus Bipolaricaulia bacterium]